MIKTLTIDTFKGVLTSYREGNINSGYAYDVPTSSYNPFAAPGNLSWNNAVVQINPNENVITDLIMDGKERVESGILYVYCIGHTGRLYKIQVNNPSTYNPDYDNAVLIATLATNAPTFTRGGFMDFFGATEKIYIGHDKGVTSINFDGTGEGFVGALGSWTQNVPRPLKQFIGSLFIGNGTNIAQIDSTATVTTYTKLTPSFPTSTQVRDIDVSTDGNYLHMVVSRLALPDITVGTQDTTQTSSSESYVFKWNGTDLGYTSFNTFPSFSLTANKIFQNYQYVFGYDQYGSAVYNPNEKIISLSESISPLPNAVSSNGNLVTWLAPLRYNGVLEADLFCWGNLDWEIGNPGYYDLMSLNAKSPQTDIVQVPFQLPVSNLGIGASSNGYTNNIFSTSKIYFSTMETSATPTTKYRFYKWSPIIDNQTVSNNILVGATYQTQTQLFSKKVIVREVRIYADPWIAGNSFTISLVGPQDIDIQGTSRTFTAGTNLTVGDDYVWYNPQCPPTYSIAIKFVNQGSVSHIINKVEIDYEEAGK